MWNVMLNKVQLLIFMKEWYENLLDQRLNKNWVSTKSSGFTCYYCKENR